MVRQEPGEDGLAKRGIGSFEGAKSSVAADTTASTNGPVKKMKLLKEVESDWNMAPIDSTDRGGKSLRKREEPAAAPPKKVKLPPRVPRYRTAGGKYPDGKLLKNVEVVVGEQEILEDEGAALFDPRLTAVFAESMETDEAPVHRVTEFTIYDKDGFLCPLDAGLIEKGQDIYCQAAIKPIYDDINTPEGGPFCRAIGPITEWHFEGFDGGERSVIGFATVYAEYKMLGVPGKEYAPFMALIGEKALLLKLTIEFLEENPEGTYEELMGAVVGKRPSGLEAEPISEEALLRHASSLLDQIWDYDQMALPDDATALGQGEGGSSSTGAATEPNDPDVPQLFFTPAMVYLSKLEGYSLSQRRRMRRPGGHRRRMAKKKIHTGMLATTTPLVRWVFEDYFKAEMAGVKRVKDDGWMKFLVECDGQEVVCKSSEGKPQLGTFRYHQDEPPCIEVKVEKEGGEEVIEALTLAKFEKLAQSLGKKPRESIRFTSSKLTLGGTAKEAGWVEGSEEEAMEEVEEEEPQEDTVIKAKKDAKKKPTTTKEKSSKPKAELAGNGVAWKGKGEVSGTRTFYSEVSVGGMDLECGDFCSALEDGEEVVCRIIAMWEQEPSSSSKKKKAKKLFAGHKYMKGANTLLGGVADTREIFQLDEMLELPISAMVSQARVSIRRVADDWFKRGGEPIEVHQEEIGMLVTDATAAGKTDYYVQKVYEPVFARFVDYPEPCQLLPEVAYAKDSQFDVTEFVDHIVETRWNKEDPLTCIVVCIEDLVSFGILTASVGYAAIERAQKNLDERVDTMVLGEGTTIKGKKAMSFKAAQVSGTRFNTGDCVYLTSDAFSLDYEVPEDDKSWQDDLEARRQDTVKYPELWRLKQGRKMKGSHDGTAPFRIAQVESIYREGEDLFLKVRKFYRPHDIHKGKEYALRQHPHLLYWSYETCKVELGEIKGVCRVGYKTVDDDEEPWPASQGGSKYKDTFFFREAYDTRAKKPAIAAVPEEAVKATWSTLDAGDGGDQSNSKGKAKGKGRASPEASESTESTEEVLGNTDTSESPSFTPLDCLDIFAGCGGLTQGFHDSGAVKTRWACEFDERAADAFRLNFPDATMFTTDCNIILKRIMEGEQEDGKGNILPRRGEVKAMCGGPPCQGFSGMNRFNQGQYSRFKNSLVSTYLSYCDYFRPRFFLLENVKNFGHFKDGVVLKMVVRALLTMGYQVTFGALQAGSFGVPQTRRRMIIMAAAPGEILPNFPEPTHTFTKVGLQLNCILNNQVYCPITRDDGCAPLRRITVKDAIGDLPVVALGNSKEEMAYEGPITTYQRLMRAEMKGEKSSIVYDHLVKDMGALHLARFQNTPSWPGADWRLLPNIAISLKSGLLTKKLEYPDDTDEQRSKPEGHGGVGHEPQDSTLIPWCLPHTGNRHNNWAGLYGRLDWEGHFGTTVTNPEPMGKQGVVVHPEQHRVVSVRECARSQGFPDHFRFAGSVMDRHRQVGNAVPPPLAKAVGEQWKLCLMEAMKDQKQA